MTTKEHLKKYRELKRVIKYCEQKIAEGDTEIDLPIVKARHALTVSRIENAVAQLTDPTEQLLIRLRYFEGYSWTKVGLTLHYSKSSIMRIHVQALNHMEQNGALVE